MLPCEAQQLLWKHDNCNVKDLPERKMQPALRGLRPRRERDVNIRGVDAFRPITPRPGSLPTHQARKGSHGSTASSLETYNSSFSQLPTQSSLT